MRQQLCGNGVAKLSLRSKTALLDFQIAEWFVVHEQDYGENSGELFELSTFGSALVYFR